MFLDLDNFKLVNDSLGHKVGDQLLVSVGERLRQCIRSCDSVARLGGDEFTILIDSPTGITEATHVADRIAEQLQPSFRLEEHEVFTHTSIGIAVSTSSLDNPDDLLRNADTAMYEAKNKGKARAMVFNPSMNACVTTRLAMENDLRRAVEREELVIHYQPIVDLESGRILEVEALVRWQHPTRGLVPPLEFIPLAEETGLILPIGDWVLEEASRQVRAWQSRSSNEQPLILSVNLSGRQFDQPLLVESIAGILQKTNFDPRYLKFEITESIALESGKSTLATLRQLRGLGIHLAVDDFGTGYSALSYLKEYPIDTLKIDQSFIRGIGKNDEDTAIAHAVIAFAKALNLNVTAEGIETCEQLSKLQELGCQWGQGYYFAKPMPTESVAALLTAGHMFEVTTGKEEAIGVAA